MLKRIFTSATLALAASLCLSQGARATTVTFDDIDIAPAPYGHYTNNFYDGGLHFMDNEVDVIGADLLDVPTGDNTQFIEAGALPGSNEPLSIFLNDGGLGGRFNLWSLQMGLGDWNLAPLGTTDSVTITGYKAADCTVNCGPTTETINVGYGFTTFDLTGFTDLSSLTIGQQMMGPPGDQTVDEGWLALDNVVYTAGVTGPPGVPEPAAWALMIVGFGGVGAMMRRNRNASVASAV